MATFLSGMDSRTLSMVCVINAMMMTAALAYIARGDKNHDGAGAWVAANASLALALAAIALRGIAPPVVTILLANVFAFLFYPLMHRGLCLFHGRDTSPWPLLYPVVAVLAAMAFNVFAWEPGGRVVSVAVLKMAAMVHLLVLLQRLHNPALARAQRPLKVVVGVAILFSLFAAVPSVFWPQGQMLFTAEYTPAFFLLVLLGNTAWTLGLVILLDQRLALERTQLTGALQESNRKLDLALRAGKLGAWECDLATRRVTWAGEHAALFGVPQEETRTTLEDMLARVHPDDRAASSAEFLHALESATGYDHAYRVLWPDGTTRWLHCHGQFFRAEDGNPERMAGVTRDITEQKEAEEALRETEQLYRDMFEKNRAIKMLIDPESGDIVAANPAACQFYQYSREALMARKIWDINVLGEDETRREMQRALSGERTVFDFQHRLASGGIRDVQVFSGRIESGGKPLLHSIVVDVTDRKRAEEALRESETRVRRKLDSLLMPESEEDVTLALGDVVDTEAVQQIMNDFFALTNIGIGIIDLEGNILVATGWQDICTQFHRQHPEACRYCIESDTELSSGVAPGEFKAYHCKNNLWDIATPIYLGEQHVGNVFLGQFFYDDEEIDYAVFREQAREYGFDEAAYMAALDRASRFSRETVDAAMRFYARFAQFISQLSLSNVKLARTLAERDRLLESLRQSEERYRNLVEGSPDIVYEYSSTRGALYWSQRVTDILGYAPDWLAEDPFAWRRAIHPDDLDRVDTAIEMSATQTHFDIEYRIQDTRGQWHWFRDRSIRMRYVEEERVIEGLATDITARKEAEDALRESLANLRLAQRIAEIGNFSYDPETDTAVWSEQVYTILERDPGQGAMRYAEYKEAFEGPAWRRFITAVEAAVNNGTPCDLTLKATLPGGKEKWVRAICDCASEPGPAGYALRGTIQDVTRQRRLELERLELERRVLEAQRAESLSTLAGGIAHDFNNLLFAVLGGAELLAETIDPGSSDRQILDEVIRSAERAAALAQQMLAYSGRGHFVLEKVDLNSLVQETVDRMAPSMADGVRLHVDLDAEVPPVSADPTQMRQAAANLLTNAAEALGDGPGEISVRTSFRHYDAAELEAGAIDDEVLSGDYVTLEIVDTGPGIETPDLATIFEPFYTTKFTGRGLGLAAVQGIVNGHGGAILVESKPGEGTRFRVLLPHAEAMAGRQAAETQPDADESRPRHVLLADDQDSVRAIAARMLRRLGLEPLEAATGEAAVEQYGNHAGSIVCVLLDFSMPDTSAAAVCRQLYELNPDARVVMISGYDQSQVDEEMGDLTVAGFIHKPFRMAALQEALKDIGVV